MKDDMLSALARGPEGRCLVQFFEAHHLPVDGSKPHEHGVSAMISGNTLNNEIGSAVIHDGNLNHEYLAHLSGPLSRCTVNLATLLAMATAYCRFEQASAQEALQSIQAQTKAETKRRGKKNARAARSRRNKV